MRRRSLVRLMGTLVALVALSGVAASPSAAAGKPAKDNNGIQYHGGPVMLGTTHLYYIWYGDWSARSADQSVLRGFANNVGGSPYFNINTTYFDGAGLHVSNSVELSGEYVESSSLHGTALSDSDVTAIVSDNGAIDPNGVYIVLTGPDVTEASGFGTSYCSWHTHTTMGGVDIKYAFVGDPQALGALASGCEAQPIGPNGTEAGDAMVNQVGRVLDSAVSDPDLNAWYVSKASHKAPSTLGYESADLCNWTFGSEYAAGNGSAANMNLGGRDYLIQQNWVNASGGFCATSYP